MKTGITINGKEYLFELDREHYRKYVLEDAEYAAIQGKLGKLGNIIKSKKEEVSDDEISKRISDIILEQDATLYIRLNMIEQEKIFYASLLKNQPKMTVANANKLLDDAITEYGIDEVDELCKELTQNFTRVGNTEKKKMVKRIV